ncbi:MAG: DUF3341 domain-containing protein, partial [Candidatus Krumholzibacteria bacterium]|nr:DUF3341 domain-containing protein [Candidatus Krumholzibacteria bacterium]
MERYEFDDKHEFIKKVEEIVDSGVPKKTINTFTPYIVHEIEELLDTSQSNVRFFAGTGGVTGLAAGFAFTIYTVLAWPLYTGGKPLISIPAFLVISYDLTILLGVLTAFVGFFALARLP